MDRLDIGLRLPSFRPPRKLSLGKAPEEYNAEDMQRIIDGLEQWSENVQAQRTQEAFNLISEAFRRLDKRDASFAQQLAKGLDDLIRRPKVKVAPGDGPFLDLLYRSVVPWHLQPKMRDALYGSFENLHTVWTSNASVTVTADKISIGGIGHDSVSVVVTMPTDLDTGGETASTGYHVFLITGPRGEGLKGLYSLSATAPVLPAGYSLFKRVRYVFNNSGSNFYNFYASGNRVIYNDAGTMAAPFLVINAVAAIAYTAQSVAGLVPSTAEEAIVKIHIDNAGPAAADLFFRARPTGSLLPDDASMDVIEICNVQPNDCVQMRTDELYLNPLQSFDWRTGTTNQDAILYLEGYKEKELG